MKKIGAIIACLFILLSAIPSQAALLNNVKSDEMKDNVNTLAAQTEYNTTTTVESTIGSVIRLAMSLLGSIFIILIIIAGINWMRAGGNEDVVKKSKSTITNLIIGLIIVIAAYALSSFISNAFSGLLTNK